MSAAVIEIPKRGGGVEPYAAVDSGLAVALVGTGLVGGALLQQLAYGIGRLAAIHLVGVANSRNSIVDNAGIAAHQASQRLDRGTRSDLDALTDALDRSAASCRILIDATPAHAVASRHPEWLARGIHVVTANKIAQGTSLTNWQSLRAASQYGRSRYGAAATVGAGLPVISTLQRLCASGDRLLALQGVMSGSLSYLFNRYDGNAAFSTLLDQARLLGYTEPDPRADLSGSDVARKLLILARTAGFDLDEGAVQVESLIPPDLAELSTEAFQSRIVEVDRLVEQRFLAAQSAGKRLCYLAELDAAGNARVGLRAIAPDHPAASLREADNLFALTTTRYSERPLLIQGPGAGAAVTAQALIADVLDIAASQA